MWVGWMISSSVPSLASSTFNPALRERAVGTRTRERVHCLRIFDYFEILGVSVVSGLANTEPYFTFSKVYCFDVVWNMIPSLDIQWKMQVKHIK